MQAAGEAVAAGVSWGQEEDAVEEEDGEEKAFGVSWNSILNA